MRIASATVIAVVSLTSSLMSAEVGSRGVVDASVTSQRFCLGADSEVDTAFLQMAFKIRNTGVQPVVVCTACLRVMSVTFLKDGGLSESRLSESQVSRQELDVFVLKEGVLKDSAFAVVKQQDQVLIPHEVVAAIAKSGVLVSGFPSDGR